ncbi:peptidylprolyl isomerase [Bacteroides sp. 224]|uniref:peptidylprolyl isomerase n=1 Tax=Bacteroides sp. 224 TaxID=2302936 RepID=UPI0013D67ED0|nr:peptidylprolyl isomerase [Bacteroides sp. 224]NDV65578.1 peptidylprolyl isomerase [Bacteroides sp. 224]
MATLQNIRSKGPLLIIVIGLALFAFIAGDAWKVIQPHQSQDVGEVNGKAVSAQDFQALVEEYSEVVKMTNNFSSLTDEQTNQIKDEVWRSYVNNKLIEAEAAKIGLVVSKEEVQAMIDAGTNPMLQATPFRNPQTGAFDKDMLKKFLVDYAKMDKNTMPTQYVSLGKLWAFVEKSLVQNRLAEKYQALISKALSSNSVEAKAVFDARVNQMDLMLAAIPYSSVPDTLVGGVKVSEVKELYNKRKEQYRQYVESRDVKYIDVQVVASEEDKAALQNEVTEAVEQLNEATSDYASLVRSADSEYPYMDLFCNQAAFPADVASRLDSVGMGEVYGPYFNAADNTLNAFKKIAKVTAADSVEYRQIQVYHQDMLKTKALADSIYDALKGGAKFEDLATLYGQPGTKTWLTAPSYEGAQLNSDDLKYITAITNLSVNETANVSIGVANVIVQVTAKKAMKEKYKVAVVKRTINFSNDTYNKAYNDFSQFVAANSTLEQVEANAEDAGYKLLDRSDLNSAEYGIGSIKGTKEALRWAFAAKPGEVSGLYECGNNDRLLVVALSKVNKEGYRSLESVQSQLRAEVIKDKKAALIMNNMKAAGISSFDQYKAMENAVSDSVKHVSFSAPAYISSLYSSEPLVGAYASVAQLNQLSAPIKGNAGVMVMQVYNKETQNETFDVEKEKQTVNGMHERMLSRLINDLYLKANVKDNRYLFF